LAWTSLLFIFEEKKLQIRVFVCPCETFFCAKYVTRVRNRNGEQLEISLLFHLCESWSFVTIVPSIYPDTQNGKHSHCSRTPQELSSTRRATGRHNTGSDPSIPSMLPAREAGKGRRGNIEPMQRTGLTTYPVCTRLAVPGDAAEIKLRPKTTSEMKYRQVLFSRSSVLIHFRGQYEDNCPILVPPHHRSKRTSGVLQDL